MITHEVGVTAEEFVALMLVQDITYYIISN